MVLALDSCTIALESEARQLDIFLSMFALDGFTEEEEVEFPMWDLVAKE